MKIALCQIDTTVGDFEGNSKKIMEFAKESYAELTVFPELTICGYPPRDLVTDPHFIDKCEETLETLASTLPPHRYFIVGTPRRGKAQAFGESHIYNSAALIYAGRVQGYQDKMLLPNNDVFDEPRLFKSGKSQRLFKIEDKMVGIVVCEDGWNNHRFNQMNKRIDPYDVDPVAQIALQGAEIIINISASPFYVGKYKVRQQLLECTFQDHGVPLLWLNQVGGNDHLVFDGNSMIVTTDGEIYEAKAFEEDILVYNTETNMVSQSSGYQNHEDVESIYHALVLGVKDYAKKCGFKTAILGLSGGIDLAVTAAIAVKALGKDNVFGVTMPSKYSSDGSVDDSAALAKALGIKLHRISIQGMKETIVGNIEDSEILGSLAFTKNHLDVTGLADENLQARIRGTILMTLSNQYGALVLTTGNKSELAVGYCTLYGDMCGGLAVISDVPKTMVYKLAKYINQINGKTIIPKSTITKPPSAELAPNQVDANSLPDYDTLDGILDMYVQKLKSPEEIAIHYPADVVNKVIRLVDRSEYKRQQAAPGIKISEKAFGWGRKYCISAKSMYTENNSNSIHGVSTNGEQFKKKDKTGL